MKKIMSLVVVSMILFGCSLDGDDTTFTYELVPTTAVEMPDTLVFRNEYIFNVTYQRPSQCHVFNGFQFEKNGNERIVGVVSEVFANPDCEVFADSTATAPLNFTVVRDDFYTFKFWQGEDENGEPIYLTKQVPVKTEQP